MRTNYILVDFENVQPTSLAGLTAEHFRVLIFIGAKQTGVPVQFAAALQPLGTRARYIRISGSGHNALDFHIAYYLGELVQEEPTADFHVVSKDTGFDPLVQHLKSKNIAVRRSADIDEISLLQRTHSKTLQEKIAAVIVNLRQRGISRPASVKTLSGTIRALFNDELSGEELTLLLAELQASGSVTIIDDKVSYSLPEQ